MFSNAYQDVVLERHPVSENPTLQAWDAADRYVLSYFAEQHVAVEGSVLVVNDGFGALAVPLCLAGYTIASYGDSFLAHQAVRKNLLANGADEKGVEVVPSTRSLEGSYDAVIVKIPKTAALLEDQLYQIRRICTKNTRIIAAGKSKHIHSSTIALFEKIIGTTTTSRAQSKARLIFSTFDEALQPRENPWPKRWKYQGNLVTNHANVFSARKIDKGTALLLQYIQNEYTHANEPRQVVDLGCGNGLLGLVIAKKYPEVSVLGTDQSYMAVRSAQENVEVWGVSSQVSFEPADSLQSDREVALVDPGTVDLVVCNPPFHADYVMGDQTAFTMFSDAKKALIEGGKLLVVGNRHLQYHQKLRRLFGNCKTVASTAKFVVLEATRR